jgi:hypothetical protein
VVFKAAPQPRFSLIPSAFLVQDFFLITDSRHRKVTALWRTTAGLSMFYDRIASIGLCLLGLLMQFIGLNYSSPHRSPRDQIATRAAQLNDIGFPGAQV